MAEYTQIGPLRVRTDIVQKGKATIQAAQISNQAVQRGDIYAADKGKLAAALLGYKTAPIHAAPKTSVQLRSVELQAAPSTSTPPWGLLAVVAAGAALLLTVLRRDA